MLRTLDTRQIFTTISIATLSLDPEHLLVKDGSGRMGVTFWLQIAAVQCTLATSTRDIFGYVISV
jgi:hypothetical protein